MIAIGRSCPQVGAVVADHDARTRHALHGALSRVGDLSDRHEELVWLLVQGIRNEQTRTGSSFSFADAAAALQWAAGASVAA